MSKERFSMKDWKPQYLYTKIQIIESQLQEIEDKKNPLIGEKRKIELELVGINADLKSCFHESKEFGVLNSKRGRLVQQKGGIELQLNEIKQRSQKLHREKDQLKMDLKKIPNDAITESLVELKDKYISFSSDTTRVSSMRAMASRFVEELTILIKLLSN